MRLSATIPVTKQQAPQLANLAEACNHGACNVRAIARSLSDCMNEVPFGEERCHPAIAIVIGQISYLCGESTGPTEQALAAYNEWTGGAA
jgi:hypothetical protein